MIPPLPMTPVPVLPPLPPPAPPAPGTAVGVGSGVGTGVGLGAAAAPHAASVRMAAPSRAGSVRGVSMAARRRDLDAGSCRLERVNSRRMSLFPGVDRWRLSEQVAEIIRALEQHQLRERVDVEGEVLVPRQVDDLRCQIDRQLDVWVAGDQLEQLAVPLGV